MTALIATAYFSSLGVLAAAFFTLLAQTRSLERGMSELRSHVDQGAADIRVALARIEQKFDDHIAAPLEQAHASESVRQ